MAIRIDGADKRIGLALSGGGFRAAAFHLGALRRLRELGLLPCIDLLSCVSGGSIAGGFLAAHWGSADVLERLEHYLRTRSIAVSSVLGGVFDPFSSRLDKLAESYDEDLFKGITLAHLCAGPRIYFNATNLATGNMFFFVAGGGGASELGEWQLGVGPADGFRVSRAVAASSAFPPVFPPLRVDTAEYAAAQTEYVTLTDGGVYDNLGVNPLLRKRNALDFAIVSDGGKPFAIDPEPTEAGTVVLKAALGILMEQVRGLQFDRLQFRHLAGQGPKPVWYSIDSGEGEARPGDAVFASSIGTNLKRLVDAEMDVLMRHGAALLQSRLERYLPELLAAAPGR